MSGPLTGTRAGVAAGIALGAVILPNEILVWRLGFPLRRAGLAP
jgi:hypothetical protein